MLVHYSLYVPLTTKSVVFIYFQVKNEHPMAWPASTIVNDRFVPRQGSTQAGFLWLGGGPICCWKTFILVHAVYWIRMKVVQQLTCF